MSNAIVTVTIMPTSPEIDLEKVKEKALADIKAFNDGKETKEEIEPVAFGLKALKIIFVVDESKGSPDQVSEKIADYEEVNSAEITDVRRAVG
jgi:elongation factor 1-beta